MKNLNKSTKIVLLTIAILLSSYYAIAQDKRFTIAMYADPVATTKNGFNIGASIDYQMQLMYFKAQVFTFPNLNGTNYTEFTGTPLGFNYHSKFDDLRIYSGLKLGVIYRDGPNPTYGVEAGIEYYFRDFFIGLMVSRDRRTDSIIWKTEPYWRNSGFIKIGIEL
ncbi:hypothetical protein [Lacinutrix sp. Hel_I_90]|uniref:hypothetical protein n=1 Tax=Lacinutrix sp. Hel_I_90 TaxID=1249999 RepID=UPI0012E00241|nr:hypothetical protein [Lacinutrix sp. Hel_I_90]